MRGDDDRPDLAPAQARPVHHATATTATHRRLGRLPTHCVLVETPEGRLLWDTSCPRDWEERWGPTGLQDFFPYDKVTEEEYLDSRLQQLGVGLDEIDYVVLSHLHFDHAGNVKMFEGTNAKLVCHQREKDFAFNFDGLFTGAHLKTDYEGLEFETVSGDTEILPGVTLLETPGHTIGCMSMQVELPDSGTMIFTSDAVYMGDSYGPPVHARRHRQQPRAVVLVGGEAARASRSARTRRWSSGTTPTRSTSCAWRRRSPTRDAIRWLREETIFTWGAPPLKFGAGAADEIGFDLAGYGVRRVLVVTDPGVNALGAPSRIADALKRYDIEAEIFDGVHVEPTDDSMNKAVEYARAQGDWDGFVAVGGGSAIDTAKAINLLTSLPRRADGLHQQADRQRQDSPGPAQAAGRRADDGGHRLGVHRDVRARHPVDEGQDRASATGGCARPWPSIDPLLTMSLPPEVTASSGMDIVCHAVESYTARWYATFDRKKPEERVTYCGSNPVSDLWCEKSMTLHRASRSATPCTAARTTSRPART